MFFCLLPREKLIYFGNKGVSDQAPHHQGQIDMSGSQRKVFTQRRMVLAGGVLALGLGAAFLTLHNPPQLVEVQVMQPGPVSLVLALNGHVRPETEVALRPLVSAYVETVAVQEGQRVARGDLLVQLDSRLLQARRDQALAALEVQKAREAQARNAARRAEGLGASVISRADAEGAELALATAQGESLRLTAALEEVERELARYSLRAPIAGVVLTRSVEPGQQVTLQDTLMTLAEPEEVLIEAEVDELYSRRIEVGQSARLRAIGHHDTHKGHIAFAAPRLDPESAGRRIEILFDTPTVLPIGLTVEVNIDVGLEENALSVPRTALLREGAGWQVLVAEGERAMPRDVAILDWPSARVMVTDGLKAGETVLTAPGALEPRSEIRVP